MTERSPLERSLHAAGLAPADVDFSTRRRAEYSADASNYRHVPLGVVFPRGADDVAAALAVCRDHGVALTPRGGGTSVAGNAIGEGLVMDCSRHFGRILDVDTVARTARVEPGVVLSTLQAALRPHGLRFGPDPSTASRCTIGGMVGNNACGARSLAWGTTADNVAELEVLLADGTRTTARRGTSGSPDLDRRLKALTLRRAGVIRRELGRFPRQASGYAMQHLLPENGFDVARALVGSEGTAAVLLSATLRLVPIPAVSVLVVAAYPDMVAAAEDVPRALAHQPSAIEGMGAELVEVWSTRRHQPVPPLLPRGGGWLFLEISGDAPDEVRTRAEALAADLPGARETRVVEGAAEQRLLWRIREDGAGLATRTTDGAEAWPGFEDAAVPADRLAPYLRELTTLMARHGRRGTIFGHFGEGCLHVRIDHDLQTADGRARFADFTREAAELVAAHGGSVSGEHGDGQARSALLSRLHSPDLLDAFAEFKHAFDPSGLLNPGILVAPKAFTDDLRAPTVLAHDVPTLAFADDGGDFGRAARRCVGAGKCRSGSGGVMCPSYRATHDEKDSTRGRARVLQEMLDGRTITTGYRSPEVLDALDLCLGCKGCRTDCPVGVDMASYKAEFLHRHYRRRLRPAAHYSMGWLPVWAWMAGFAPGLVNRVLGGPGAGVVKRLGGIAEERQLPRFARRSFSRGVGRRAAVGGLADLPGGSAPAVVLWADTFTENFTPEVGAALVKVLRSAGYRVLLPPRRGCCGLTWISTGQLDVARRVQRRTLEILRPAVEAGLPIIVPEPSCAAALRTELVELLPEEPLARVLAEKITGPSEFLARQGSAGDEQITGLRSLANRREGPLRLDPGSRDEREGQPRLDPGSRDEVPPPRRKALVQLHCHEYATGGPAAATAMRDVLARVGVEAEILDAGCCGLAGDFGVVREHYEVSMRVAELALLPAIRAAAPDTLIVADGFSCRTQIQQALPERRVWHVVEVLAAALDGDGFDA